MLIKPFSINALNRHYEGSYDDLELEWRRLGAADKASNLERMLAGRRVDSVLEVGCGTGSVLAEIARRRIGKLHIGVDLADPNTHVDPGAVDLDLRLYDGSTLPFPDRSFDLVIASHVVEHVPNPRGFITELARVSNNLIYVEVPCEIRTHFKRAKLQAALNTGHINAYTPEYFLVLLQTSGLDVLNFQMYDHSASVHRYKSAALRAHTVMVLRRALLWLSPMLASRVFCYHCGALARPGKNVV